MKNSSFLFNTALYYANAILAESSVVYMNGCCVHDMPTHDSERAESSLYAQVHQLVFQGSFLVAQDLFVEMDMSKAQSLQSNIIEFPIDFPHPDPLPSNDDPQALLKNITLKCSRNYRVFAWSVVEFKDGCNGTELSNDGFCQLLDSFTFICDLAEHDKYLPEPGMFVIAKEVNEENILPASYTNYHFQKCPVPGGNCSTPAGLVANPNYWGSLSAKKKGQVEMFKCPPNICCQNKTTCKSYDSCNTDLFRDEVSRMCSKCLSGYCEVLFSQNCVPCDKCDQGWILVVMSVLLTVLVSLAAMFGVTDALVYGYKIFHASIGKALSVPKAQTHHVTVTGRPHAPHTSQQELDADNPEAEHEQQTEVDLDRPEMNEDTLDVVEDLAERAQHWTGCVPKKIRLSTIIPFVMILICMIQDNSIFPVSLYECANHKRPTWLDKLTFTNIFRFNIDVFHVMDTFRDVCVLSLAHSTAWKEFAKSSVYGLIYVIFGALFLVCCFLIPRFCTQASVKKFLKKRNVKLNLVEGFITMQLLIYQKLSSMAFQFVNCIEIGDEYILHIDANQSCHEGFSQGFAWAYLSVCIIPLCVFIIFGCCLLQKKRISLSLFLLGLVAPLVVLCWCPIGYFRGQWKEADNGPENNGNSEQEEGGNERSPEADCEVGTSQQELADDTTPLTDRRNEDAQEEDHGLTDDEVAEHVVKGLRGPFKDISMPFCTRINLKIFWLGIILGFRLVLVWISVLEHDVDKNAMYLFIICSVRVLLNVVVLPYHSCWLNGFSFLCLFLTWVLSLCNWHMATLEKSLYQNCAEDAGIQALVIVVDMITAYLPLVVCIILGLLVAACVVGKVYEVFCWVRSKFRCHSVYVSNFIRGFLFAPAVPPQNA